MRAYSILAFIAFLISPAIAQEGVNFLPLKGTESPDGNYSLGWGIRDQSIDTANPDQVLEEMDFEAVENYLIDVQQGQIMATLPSAFFQIGDSQKNHSGLSVIWRDDSQGAFIVEDGRWGYESISVIYIVEPDKKWDQCSDAIRLDQSLSRLFRIKLKQENPSKQGEIDELIFSALPEAWLGENQIRLQAYGQLPKREGSIDFDEILTVTIPGPQLVGLPESGDEGSSAESDPLLITPNSVGPIQIGMTVAEARLAYPGAEFSRTYDGEGIALISVIDDDDFQMLLFAGEWDPDAPIDESAVIEMVDVISHSYRTSQGVHVGMKLEALEGIHGRVKEIMMSEIEGREYAEFEGLSSGISYQVSHEEDTAGRYAGEEMVTSHYRTGAFLYSIQVRGASIMLDGSIGGIQLDDEADQVWASAGRHSWGPASQGKDEMWEAFGQAVQPWSFPSAGIEFDMISDDIGGPKSVYSITVKAPSTLKTSRGIGIGSSRSEVEDAYADYLPDPEGYDGHFEGQDVHLVGSIYGGMLFTFENGAVSEIFLGAMAE